MSFTQDTHLRLKTKRDDRGLSVIEDVFFTPPLKVIHPFYENHTRYGQVANILLLSVSAGLMNGDCQNIDIHIGRECQVMLSSQSFEKIHDSNGGKCFRRSRIVVEENAYLDVCPLPVLPFARCNFENSTEVFLKSHAHLSFSEIFAAGRVGLGEIFAFDRFVSRLKIYFCNEEKNELVFFDNTYLDPKIQNLSDSCYFADFTHYLNWILVGGDIEVGSLKEGVEALLKDFGLNGGVSQNGNLIIIKVLGKECEELLDFRDKLKSIHAL